MATVALVQLFGSSGASSKYRAASPQCGSGCALVEEEAHRVELAGSAMRLLFNNNLQDEAHCRQGGGRTYGIDQGEWVGGPADGAAAELKRPFRNCKEDAVRIL